MEKEYEFSVDLVLLLQVIMGVCTMIYLFRYLNKKQVSFPVMSLFLLFILLLGNSFFLRYTDVKIPNLIPAFLLFAGPLFWWFLKIYLYEETKPQILSYYHFAPGFFWIFLCLLVNPDILEPYHAIFIFLHSGFYIFKSTQEVMAYRGRNSRHLKREPDLASRKWHTSLYILLAVYIIFTKALLETFVIHPLRQYRFVFVVVFLVFTLLLWRHTFYKISYIYGVYKKRNSRKRAEKYQGSLLTALQSKTLSEQLETLMQSQKPYLDDTLEISTLAQILKTHPKNLSQAINENFHRNFFDYVNTYRVREAQKMLSDPSRQDHKIYEIMYEVGFNSRSSFNTAFKKVTGLTAGQYRKQHSKT